MRGKNSQWEEKVSSVTEVDGEFIFDDLQLTDIAEDVQTREKRTTTPELLDKSLQKQLENAVHDTTQSQIAQLVQDATDYSRYDIMFNLPAGDHPNKEEVSKAALKGIAKVKMPFGTINLPIFKTAAQHEQASKLVEDVNTAKEAVSGQTKLNGAELEIATKALMVEILNDYRNQLCYRVVQEYNKLDYEIDDDEGMWIHLRPQSNLPMRRKMLTQQFKFNANQVMSLRDASFCPNSLRSARAKLDLQHSVEKKVANEALNRPACALAKCMYAAGLTHVEVLSVVFATNARETNLFECPRCARAVNVETVMYHPKCEVVKWLLEYFFFTYDEEKKSLIARKPTYLTQRERHLLETVLSKIDELDKYITRRTESRIQVIKCQAFQPS
ncbi:hypothetical protein PGB90_006733 [Kerria lacca]